MKNILMATIAFSGLTLPAMSMECFDSDFKSTFMRAINGAKYLPAEVIVGVAAVHESEKPIGEDLACTALVVTGAGDAQWLVVHATVNASGSYKWWTTKWRVRTTN